jgi:hypothetical protein
VETEQPTYGIAEWAAALRAKRAEEELAAATREREDAALGVRKNVITKREGTSMPSRECVRWEGDLPPGYRLKKDADLMVLLGPDGSKVAAFSALGADPLEVFAAAWEDYE